MAGSGSPISWWKNDGSGNFAQDTISIAIGSRTDACVLDVDNDADLDIVSTGTYIVDWFENDGDENFTRHLIAQALSQVKSVFAVDLDGDTDIDILSAIENEDDIVWWRNSLVSMHNVGPVSIDVPSTVPFDTTIFPHATVKNFGLSTETFNAVCSIAPGGYLSTTVCNLAPAESIRVTFADPFTFAEGGAYTITVYTTLASDEWSGNDTLSKIVEVPIVLDAGAVSINIPAMVPLDTALYPEAVVKNFGSVASTFPVTCRIQPGGYLKTQTVQNLAPGVSTPVIFLNQFTFNEAAVCTVTVYTRLTDDGDPANDTLTKLVVVHDPGIAEGNTGIPGSFAFRAPTVCRGSNEIMLALPVAARVDLAVYDALGRRSKTLVNGMFGAGTYHIPARLDLSSGIYFYHLKTTSGENVVRKFLIVE
jgi:hypothetical protein